MNKVDVILESFNLDPLGSTEPYYTAEMFEEGQHFLEDTLKEAGSGVTKKSFFSKIWETIKKLWAWCCKQWTRFVNWLSRVFKRKKGQKTADQVASDIIGSNSGNTGDISSAQATNNTFNASGGVGSIKVEIPSNPASEIEVAPSIEVLIKPIMVAYDAEKDQFGISINDAHRMSSGKVPSQGTAKQQFANVIILAEKPEVLNILKEALLTIKDNNVGEEFLAKMKEFWKTFDFDVYNDYVCPFRKLNELAKSLNEIMELLNNVNISPDMTVTNNEVLSQFNQLASFCANLQMSINSFTRVMQSVYSIDTQYIGSIKTTDVLDKFVKAMIDAGIPPKYIGYNTYLASDQNLKGSKGDENNPIWGQSRLVLFPENDSTSIIKVALSGWGLQSNRSEYDLSQQITKNGGAELIAVTKSLGPTGATVIAERVKTGVSLNVSDSNAYIRSLDAFMNKHQIPFRIDDLHGKNLGEKNGKPVALDYAWGVRRNPKDLIDR